MFYNVTIETRKRGSIGRFSDTIIPVEANDASQAHRKAFTEANINRGLESRFITKVEVANG